jgi:hypothetical protein
VKRTSFGDWLMAKTDPKKPYAEPNLVIYGQIRDLTKAMGPNGMLDNGTMGRIRTKI